MPVRLLTFGDLPAVRDIWEDSKVTLRQFYPGGVPDMTLTLASQLFGDTVNLGFEVNGVIQGACAFRKGTFLIPGTTNLVPAYECVIWMLRAGNARTNFRARTKAMMQQILAQNVILWGRLPKPAPPLVQEILDNWTGAGGLAFSDTAEPPFRIYWTPTPDAGLTGLGVL